MPLCFQRALCYCPTKTLSELFFTMSLSHAPSSSSLFFCFVVECMFLFHCPSVWKCFLNCFELPFFFSIPQIHMKLIPFTDTPCRIFQLSHKQHMSSLLRAHRHIYMHKNMHNALHTPANFSTPWMPLSALGRPNTYSLLLASRVFILPFSSQTYRHTCVVLLNGRKVTYNQDLVVIDLWKIKCKFIQVINAEADFTNY